MSHSTELHEVIGTAYEAALAPERWPLVLERVADVLHGEGAALHFQDQLTGKGWGIVARVDPAAIQPYFGYFATRNPIRRGRNRLLRLFQNSESWRAQVVTDEHVLPKSELVRTEYYGDFLRPLGVHSLLMVGVALENTKFATINFLRSPRQNSFDDAEVELAGQLQPHLIRAFELGLRLSDARQLNDSLVQSLDRSPHAIFLADSDARVRHVNRAGEQLVSQGRGLSVREGILRAMTTDSTRALHRLIETAGAADCERKGGGAMPLSRPGFRRPLSVIAAPLRSEHLSFYGRSASVIVCVTDRESGGEVPEERLRALFGLTAAEARIAVDLLTGGDAASIAERKSLSVNTVRVHIARIMAKTETNRQSELVSLLERLTVM